MDVDIRNVAEVFPPGEFVKDELEARGWTQEDFSEITGLASSMISTIVTGKRSISSDVASILAAAFGTTSQFWMNLETSYQLFMAKHADESVARKARLFQKVPIKEMINRGWIEPSDNLDILEERVRMFLDIPSLDDYPNLSYAAQKSTPHGIANAWQTAWVCRAKKLARGIKANTFSNKSFSETLSKLRELRENPEDIRHVPKILAEGGVRFLLIESFSKGKIDGACFWLNESSPVIVIAMKYDRIDHFWYLLTHELGHVQNRDALGSDPILDVDLVGELSVPFSEKPEMEKLADLFAESFLVDKVRMDDFINRIRPLYSKQKIKNFAKLNGVHPAIVLGQLQHRNEVSWSHSREMLVKVRHILITSALTDGWGNKLPPIY